MIKCMNLLAGPNKLSSRTDALIYGFWLCVGERLPQSRSLKKELSGILRL